MVGAVCGCELLVYVPERRSIYGIRIFSMAPVVGDGAEHCYFVNSGSNLFLVYERIYTGHKEATWNT